MAFVLAGLLLLQTQFKAFEYREYAPALLFPYTTASVHISVPETLTNPAVLPCLQNSYCILSGSNPYTMKGLFSSGVAIGHGTGLWGMQAFWKRTGILGYAEQAAGVDAGVMPVKYVSFGAGVQYFNVSIDCDGYKADRHLCNLRLGLRVIPLKWLAFSFEHDNLLSYCVAKYRNYQFPEWSLGAALIPVRGIEINWNITSTAFGYVNTLAFSADLLRYFIFSAGYSRETDSYAAALTLVYRYLSASYGIRYHTHLGLTHSVSFSFSLRSMEVDGIHYGGGRADRTITEKVDINRCAKEDMASLPGLPESMALRIIKYRELFGPVTRKSLGQIGLSESEIDLLLHYVCGLAEEKPRARRDTRITVNSKKKELFALLLQKGLGPETAFIVAEKSNSAGEKELRRILDSDKKIPESTKNEVVDLCGRFFQ
ncbi:MAG TPA: helix-hairpin-helix domain-containing protein [Spirochaetota bacterium]|mgnify:CR=1 FL=1|nr:helix-hairpin-helix domain-containing protein [Spirochaetota bacterium]HPI87736.1 helix-hairpin-helix domain-containing protein [Spirochaetota bacterium]HPR48139.1 helix-hairpin-helix domain-containing protein [Spirochaetota bacterium]